MKLSVFLAIACTVPSLAGCAGIDMWPFSARERERSAAPRDATEYRCEGERRFYVRYMNETQAAWVILPEREFRLDRDKEAPASGVRYRSGATTLDVNGDQASLGDGAKLSFAGCKAAARAS